MKRIPTATALLVLTLGASACGSSTGSETRSAVRGSVPICPPASAEIIAANAQAAIFRSSGAVRGCTVAGGHTFTLGESSGLQHIGLAAVGGTFAAIERVSGGVDTASSQVAVIDLRTGATVRSEPAGTHPPKPETFVAVSALAIDPGGDTVWISSVGSITAPGGFQVWLAASGAAARMLDQGAGIVPLSLRLANRSVTWRDGTSSRSVRLG